jgi:hypothetical protein
MMLAWVIVSTILLAVWLIGTIAGIWTLFMEEGSDRDEEFYAVLRIICGVSFLGFVVALLWPLVVIGAIPVFLVYGMIQAVKFPFTKPWKDF